MKRRPIGKKQRALRRLINGEFIPVVASSECIPRHTLQKWARELQEGRLSPDDTIGDRSSVRSQKLSAGQINWIYHILLHRNPEEFHPNSCLWTRNLIEDLLNEWCGQTLPKGQTYRLIDELGFEFGNFLLDLRKSESIKVHEWLTSSFKHMMLEARKAKSRVYLVDEFPLKKGFLAEDLEVPAKGARVFRTQPNDTDFRVTFASDLNRKGVFFMVSTKTDEAAPVTFMSRLLNHASTSIVVVAREHSRFALASFQAHARKEWPQLKIVRAPSGR